MKKIICWMLGHKMFGSEPWIRNVENAFIETWHLKEYCVRCGKRNKKFSLNK